MKNYVLSIDAGTTSSRAVLFDKFGNQCAIAQHEFKQFFPNNAVEYFVSYYDYYQPEAYIPHSGLYIEKDLSINEWSNKIILEYPPIKIS